MKKLMRWFLAGGFLAAFGSCSDDGVQPSEARFSPTAQQVSRCVRAEVLKAFVGTTGFSYEFNSSLIVNFSLDGNCCPDSNRFALQYQLAADTIKVVAIDTTARLCRCMCTYVIHAEFDKLPLNHYVFLCVRPDQPENPVVYNEQVHRSRNLLWLEALTALRTRPSI